MVLFSARFLLLTAGVTFCLVGMSGCSGNQNVKRVVVRMWVFPMLPELRDRELYDRLVDGFRLENPDIDVQVETLPWAGRQQKMITALAGNKAPDAVYLNLDLVPRLVEMGTLRPVENDIPLEEIADYDPAVIDGVTIDKHLWMFPMLRTVAAGIYNKDLFASAGLDPEKPPLTWSELENASRAVTRDTDGDGENDQWGLAYILGGDTLNLTFWPLLWQAGGEVLSEDGLRATFNDQAGIEALSFVTRMFSEGYVPRSFIGMGGHEFAAGKVGYWLGVGQLELVQLRRDAPQLKLGVGPVLTRDRRVGYSTIGGFGIFNSTPNPKETAKWLRYITRPENMRLFCKTTNFLPTKKSLGLIYADDPLLGALERQAAYCRADIKSPYARQIMQRVAPEIQAAALGRKSPEAALNDAAAAVNAMLPATE